MDANNGKKINRMIFVVAALFVVAVLAISFIATLTYNSIANANVKENETETVVNFASSMANYTDARFSTALSRLEGYALSFKDAENMSDDDLVNKLKLCSSDNAFSQIAYVSVAGRTCTSSEMSVNPRVYVSSALTGVDTVLPSEKIYCVPVYDDHAEIIGALMGIADSSNTSFYQFSVFGVSGTSFILDANGVVISGPDIPSLDFSIGENMLNALEKENDLNNLKTALSQKTVHISDNFTYKGEKYVAGISSLTSQDWTIVTIVPESALVEHAESVITPMNSIVFGLTAVFVILAGYLFYFTYHIRKKADAIVDENNKINYIDDITGFSSWKSFMESYEKSAVDTSSNRALLALDIDKFKTNNDTLGYEGGNNILKKVAEIIDCDIADSDFFARNGADHFIILAHYDKEEEITELVNHIITDIEYQITDIKVTVSIGIYPITDRNLPIRASLDRANIARNTIKNLAESRYVYFNYTMMESIRAEKSIENIMEDALEKGEFLVYLQPKYGLVEDNSAPNGEVIGAEALVRWRHEGEIISPGKFIPVFEKNGFITKLDFYMFREVCKLQRTWKNKGLTPRIISVNMSRLHFPDPNFVDTLKKYCDEYGIETKYFEIEITESAAYENINILMDVFSKIKEAGFHVSIDDFGTGYSSLNMLKDLPVDVLKIDRSFLTENADEEENASKIIGCVVSLASSLDIATICEGIETKEQANLLSKLGCDMAQGFYFARPMPVKDFEKLVYDIKE
ncbi:MAG: EAL domain-containing protein [Ruminiclostridium sp.]|nr:EAL domain-containing protein [Ruminiclostridium sp.]